MTESKRIILFTGKGGVGKTSVAAATALRCAELGQRTIILSTDPAHSLSDSFDLPIGPEPAPVAPNLDGQEVDVFHQMDKYWGVVQAWLANVLVWRGVDGLLAAEASLFPGMEELASLLQVIHLYESGDYETIIVDCAPTGETLRLLSLPEMARWYLSHTLRVPVDRRSAGLAGPLLRALADIPVPDADVLAALEKLIFHLEEMHRLLANPDLSSLRLVMTPEKMVIKEAQRTYTYLNLYGFVTDAVVCNRLLTPATDGYFAAWRQTQEKYLALIWEGFSPLPLLTAPFFPEEVVGLPMLQQLGEALYGQTNPAEILFRGTTHTISQVDDHYQLTVPLPFASRDKINLTRSNDELVIQINNHRRNLILPRPLVPLKITDARYQGQNLIVRFAPPKR